MVESSPMEPSQGTDASLPVAQGEVTDAYSYLTFKVDETVYGIALDHIKEIIEYGPLTQVPLAPAFVRGVFNLRGSVLPVIDLAVRLGKKPQEANKRSCFILVEQESEEGVIEAGFLVDTVEAVVPIPDEDVEPPPSFGVDIRGDFISGMGKRNDNFVILLEVDQVFAVDELAEYMRTEGGSATEEESHG